MEFCFFTIFSLIFVKSYVELCGFLAGDFPWIVVVAYNT